MWEGVSISFTPVGSRNRIANGSSVGRASSHVKDLLFSLSIPRCDVIGKTGRPEKKKKKFWLLLLDSSQTVSSFATGPTDDVHTTAHWSRNRIALGRKFCDIPPSSILYRLEKTKSAQDSCSTYISVEYLETTPRRMAHKGESLIIFPILVLYGESLERVDQCSRDDSRYIIAGNPVSLQLYMNPRTLPSRHVCEMIDKRDDRETKKIWKFSFFFLFSSTMKSVSSQSHWKNKTRRTHKSFFF